MCMPKVSVPKTPPAVERQAVQTPQDPVDQRVGLNARRRRGMWASIMTSPRGVLGAPSVTALGAGATGAGSGG